MYKTESNIFNKFPKIRPSLPKEIETIYSDHYKVNRKGETSATSLAKRMESWMHKQVAKDITDSQNNKKATLELGAGTLNQLKYESQVHPYDIVEPFTDLYKDSLFLAKIRNIYSDISEIPNDYRYERITSIATLEHICNLPKVIAQSGLLLSENGVFRASIPSEGTILWTLGWKLTTGIEYKLKYGLDYSLLMRHEHVNTAKEIEEVLEYFFEKVDCKVFGLSKGLSFYRYYECKSPRTERCSNFLNNAQNNNL